MQSGSRNWKSGGGLLKLEKAFVARENPDSFSEFMKRHLIVLHGLALSLTQPASVPCRAAEGSAATARVLPGNGLAQHDFLYAGESKNRRVFIIRKSQAWKTLQ